MARYSYDAWGVCTVTSDTSSINLSSINPYRYRSYYYDTEIGLYYLQSRYYDPVVGRFICGDEPIIGSTINNGLISNNLFVYTNNSPVIFVDKTGYTAIAVSPYIYAQMLSMSAAATTLAVSINTLVAMIWNIFLVVGLLLIVIAAIVNICNSIEKIRHEIESHVSQNKPEDYKNYKNIICVYVLTRTDNPLQSIFYVGRTKNTIARYNKHSNPYSKYYKGKFYMFVIYTCTSEIQSKVIEQAVLSACLVGKFTQIIFGQSPSNKIRGIAKNNTRSVIKKLNEDLDDTLSLLGCTSENELLYLMNQ